MTYLLIAPSLERPDFDVESYPTIKEAMAHKGDKQWAIVAYTEPNPGEIDVRLITVYFWNVEQVEYDSNGQPVVTPAVERWTKVTRT